MICRRRIPRNPAFICLLFVSVGFLLIKTGNIIVFKNQQHSVENLIDKRNNGDSGGDESKVHVPSQHVIQQTDDPSLAEIARLSKDIKDVKQVVVKKKDNKPLESDYEMMKKYNETLKHQAEMLDPFRTDSEKDKYTDFLNFEPQFADTQYTSEQLRPVIASLNKRRLTYNADKFPNLPQDHPVVVIQVHKRIVYFKELLDSLQHAKGIENVLLVISHDFYLDSLNALIRQIKFCQVIQIFFPYSLQLYPDQFPGQSLNDCPRDIKKKDAIEKGCLNAEHPDQFGHYREAPVTMIKHHWWWKINMVFDELLATKEHNGPVLFIEEDHYVSPSFYNDLMQLHKLKHTEPRCTDSCEILTLGSYSKKENYQTHGERVLHGVWISTQHNMGMAMYRSTWQKLKICAAVFCTFDDYNWDWTLMHLSKTCIGKILTVLHYELPRIYHIGDCGLHHTKSCDSKDTLNKVKRIIGNNKDFLFNKNVIVLDDLSKHNAQKPNGGWGDVRDHELCLNFVKADPKLMR